MKYDIQLNVRMNALLMDALKSAAEEVGTTPSQIAREAVIKELNRRKSWKKPRSGS
jgi:predicted transcriptional regulator